MEEEIKNPDDPQIEISEKDESPKVEIDLNKEESPKDDKPVSADEFRKAQNRNEYLNRQMQKMMETVNELKQNVQQPVQEPEQPKVELDEIDQAAEKDWKVGVSMLAKREYEQLKAADKKKEAEQIALHQQHQALESSKQTVLKRYPNIDDSSTSEGQLYIQAINENPMLLKNTQGPELAMYKMEEIMRNQGQQPQFNKDVDLEVQRRTRVGASSVSNSRPANDNKVILSQQEIDIAKSMNIPISEYAKMYKLTNRDYREGVTVDE